MARFRNAAIVGSFVLVLGSTLGACDADDDPGDTLPADSETTEPIGS